MTLGKPAPADDGLWLVNMANDFNELIISLAEIASFEPEESMIGADHYFNHVLWNPRGDRFFFLHLWRCPNGRRLARACVWDLYAARYKLLGPRGLVSHHCWIDDDHVVVFASNSDNRHAYQVFAVDGSRVAVLGTGQLTKDGHPSMSPHGSHHMITDTYPDRLAEQRLLLFTPAVGKLRQLARFYSPLRFRGEIRCDLHPRWNRAGSAVCVDSAHRGSRHLCIIGLPQELLSKN